MKKVVILTKQYPYGNREQFLDAEIQQYSKKNIPVEFVSVFVNNNNEKQVRSLPNGVEQALVLNAANMNISMMRCILRSVVSKENYEEIKRQKIRGGVTKYKIVSSLKFLAKSFYIMNQLEKRYKNELINDNTAITFYSYWLEESACALSFLCEKYNCKAISRVHGFDLYNERHRDDYLPFQEYMVKHLSGVAPISNEGKIYLERKYNSETNIKVCRLGTEDYGLGPINGEKYTIVSCSNVIPIKRVELIAEAVAFLDLEDVIWIHMGDGGLLDLVKKVISKCNKTECRLLGRLNHNEIFDFYKENHVDLFINLSTTEGIPVSIMEAFSFGIPVLATDVGGTHEVVKDNYNGNLIDVSASAEQIANAIISLKNMSKTELKKMRDNARKFWENNYFADTNYSEFIRFLEK